DIIKSPQIQIRSPIGSRGVVSSPVPHHPAYGFELASLAPCHSGEAGEIAANAAAALYTGRFPSDTLTHRGLEALLQRAHAGHSQNVPPYVLPASSSSRHDRYNLNPCPTLAPGSGVGGLDVRLR